ncbi:DUF1203 domain-containing protein [Herbidospora sp. NEAU-GS84]|uniref:DUF1203 domain-containing protein n=1 Tax=Herbidospora solisilvae TaxID=2696284 RepID=A0A7C9NZ05_9ACTN|nr:DUF1203 domain-containing protein [Herbidospora solisilvae]NAS21257.1 DUF1203 domain-containing protein [Herbidospora solisilvae]
MNLTVSPIEPFVVKALLVTDDAGHAPRFSEDRDGGSPLRCCLTLAGPGERVALLSYAPVRRWAADPGPYDELGPVFVHAGPCAGPDGDGWPAAHRGVPRVLRAYDGRGHIVGGRTVPAEGDPERVAEELLAGDGVAVVHVRAVVFGCFQFSVR